MIKIYGTPTCGFCLRAKKLAERHGLTYEYFDVTYSKYRDQMNEALGSKTAETVPQIWWYDKHIGGYQEFSEEIDNTRTYGDGGF
jgi:glutaredoxin 1